MIKMIEERMKDFVAEKGIKIGSKVKYTKAGMDTNGVTKIVDTMTFLVKPPSYVILELNSADNKVIDQVVYDRLSDSIFFAYGIELAEADAADAEDTEIIDFSKNDLQDGMIVTYQNGMSRFVMNGKLYAEREDRLQKSGTLDEYADDLCHLRQSNLDIILVSYMGELVWVRTLVPEVELVTFAEASASGKKVRYNNGKGYTFLFADAEVAIDRLFYKLSKEKIIEALTMPVWEVER